MDCLVLSGDSLEWANFCIWALEKSISFGVFIYPMLIASSIFRKILSY